MHYFRIVQVEISIANIALSDKMKMIHYIPKTS